MAKPTDLIDPFFQTMLVEAEQALDKGDYLGTVRRCVEVYSRIAEQRPELILRPPKRAHASATCPVGPGGAAECATAVAGKARR